MNKNQEILVATSSKLISPKWLRLKTFNCFLNTTINTAKNSFFFSAKFWYYHLKFTQLCGFVLKINTTAIEIKSTVELRLCIFMCYVYSYIYSSERNLPHKVNKCGENKNILSLLSLIQTGANRSSNVTNRTDGMNFLKVQCKSKGPSTLCNCGCDSSYRNKVVVQISWKCSHHTTGTA